LTVSQKAALFYDESKLTMSGVFASL